MLISFIRTFIVYVVIMVAIRIMGKRQVSQLQTSELVATLLISDLAVIPMQNSGQPLTSGLIPIFVLVSLEIFVSILMLKNNKFRTTICGNPVMIINNGVLMQDQMKELRLTIQDVFEQLRINGVFSISEVKYAIIETNGSLSVMKNEDYEYVRAKDLQLEKENEELEVVVINDGEICFSALEACNKDEAWILEILQKKQVKLNEVFIMTATLSGSYNVIERFGI